MLHLVKKRHFTHTDSNASFLVIHPHSFNPLLPSRANVTQPGHSVTLSHATHLCRCVTDAAKSSTFNFFFSCLPSFYKNYHPYPRFSNQSLAIFISSPLESPSCHPDPSGTVQRTLACPPSALPPQLLPTFLIPRCIERKKQFYSLLPT